MNILDQLDAAEKAAELGPWKKLGNVIERPDGAWLLCPIRSCNEEINEKAPANLEFIELVRNNIRALIEVARAVEETVWESTRADPDNYIVPSYKIAQLCTALTKLRGAQ
jgi:hypothetical protein